MINAIGAYIVTLLIVGIALKRPSLARFDDSLCRAPVYVIALLGIFLLSLLVNQYCTTSQINFSIPYLSILSFILATLTLWIHEAGHWYLSWSSPLLHSFGGTLLELGVPIAMGSYCVYRKYYLASTLFFFWLGFNMLGVGQYMADGNEQLLPLLGGSTSSHDWAHIFGELKLLEYAKMIGSLIHALGSVIAVASAAAAIWIRANWIR